MNVRRKLITIQSEMRPKEKQIHSQYRMLRDNGAKRQELLEFKRNMRSNELHKSKCVCGVKETCPTCALIYAREMNDNGDLERYYQEIMDKEQLMVVTGGFEPIELHMIKHDELMNFYKVLQKKDIEIQELKSQISFMAKTLKDFIKTEKFIRDNLEE